MISKTKTKGSKANFLQSGKGVGVRVTPGKGVNTGTPTHCEAKRSASNLKQAYSSSTTY